MKEPPLEEGYVIFHLEPPLIVVVDIRIYHEVRESKPIYKRRAE